MPINFLNFALGKVIAKNEACMKLHSLVRWSNTWGLPMGPVGIGGYLVVIFAYALLLAHLQQQRRQPPM